jgi:transcriptional regulator with XRE-family HTH domain
MTDGHNYLRAWREHRRMTQMELAFSIEPPTTGAVISLLEMGQRKLSPKWLRKLAPVLNTTVGDLLERHPADAPTAILDVWAGIPDEHREQALKVLETFRRTD